jgi:hypothetical protein
VSVSSPLTLPRSRYFFHPEDGGDIFLRKFLFLQDPHGATSQKIAFFEINVVHTLRFAPKDWFQQYDTMHA